MTLGAESAPRVRLARITDLAALAQISRCAQGGAVGDTADEMQSLGLPIGPAELSLYQLFRMPLSLIRSSDSIWVHERGGKADGLARVERDDRGDWTLVELDGYDDASRSRLLARVAREAGRHAVTRIHTACADRGETTALLASAGFQLYARETLMLRAANVTAVGADEAPFALRAARSDDAIRIGALFARVTPPAISRMESLDARDWERAATSGWAPRASITPLLRLAEQAAFILEGASGELDGWMHIGVARDADERHPHALRLVLLPGVLPAPLITAGLREIARRAERSGTTKNATLAVVRSHETGLTAALAAEGFARIAELRLGVRDVRARATAPGLVPAIG